MMSTVHVVVRVQKITPPMLESFFLRFFGVTGPPTFDCLYIAPGEKETEGGQWIHPGRKRARICSVWSFGGCERGGKGGGTEDKWQK